MSVWGIILAAGKGARLQSGTPKQFLSMQGVPLYWHSAAVFDRIPMIEGVVFVFPAGEALEQESMLDEYTEQVRLLAQEHAFAPLWRVAAGGNERQDSVRNALRALPVGCTHVLVHDAARPFVSAAVTQRVLTALLQGHQAVIPAVAVTDTIKQVSATGAVEHTFTRDSLRAVQTPQGFVVQTLRAAHAAAAADHWQVTDDASMVERNGGEVFVVEGDIANKKITNPEDLPLIQEEAESLLYPCTGFGYDVHKYGGDRPFILGGVPIQTDVTVAAHSDGDTLIHAVIDAILGCIGGGDIGDMFPDTAPEYAGIASGILLAEVLERSIRAGLTLQHLDITIVAQTPRIGPHKQAIAKNMAKMLAMPLYAVNVKATTEEKLGFTGEKKGIKVMAVATGVRKRPN